MPSGLPVARVAGASVQTIAGFGASGAWWPNDLASFPPDEQELASRLLFGNNGLQLSGYRYYIGGGGKGVTTPARAEKALGPKFDLKDFHAVIIDNGSMPLGVLEKVVDEWIARGGGANNP